MKKIFQWAVIGAGPGGIAAIGELLALGVAADDILWFDPEFRVGDLGKYWSEVTSNTSVALFRQFLENYQAFNYDSTKQRFTIDRLPSKQTCQLKHIVAPLQWITEKLRNSMSAHQAWVKDLNINQQGIWSVTTEANIFHAQRVILAIGCTPKQLIGHDDITVIPLETALKPSLLAEQCFAGDTVAVFGASHSAMIIIQQLVQLGVEKIMNFYLSPIRFATPLADGSVLYDNTGLKGNTAQWVKQHVMPGKVKGLKRYYANDDNIEKYIMACHKVIYAIGFEQRHLSVEGLNIQQYDSRTGIIGPGLFGTGICHPRLITTSLGQEEYNVGLYKFMRDLQVMVPIWMHY